METMYSSMRDILSYLGTKWNEFDNHRFVLIPVERGLKCELNDRQYAKAKLWYNFTTLPMLYFEKIKAKKLSFIMVKITLRNIFHIFKKCYTQLISNERNNKASNISNMFLVTFHTHTKLSI